MRYYKVTPDIGTNFYIEGNPYAIKDWLIDSEIGNILTVETIEMTQAEYDSLPEYTGP